MTEALEILLDRWARWRRTANRLPTASKATTSLARLHAEGAEVERRSRSVRNAKAALLRMRAALRARIAEAELAHRPEEVKRLRALLSKIPTTPNGLAWASLIRGQGARPPEQCDAEIEIDAAIDSLPAHLREVIHREFLIPPFVWEEQNRRAAAMRVSLTTYQRNKRAALDLLERLTT